MRIEDLTKEELIHIIRNCNRMMMDERGMLIEALNMRRTKEYEKYRQESQLSSQHLKEYKAFAKQHEGEELAKLPIEELLKWQETLEKADYHRKKAARHWKNEDQCYEKINKLLVKGE